MAFKLEPTPQELMAAAKVAESAQLTDVRLGGLVAQNRIDMTSDPEKLHSSVSFGVANYSADETGRLVVQVAVRLLVSLSGTDEQSFKDMGDCREGCARIDVAMIAEYRIPAGPVPDNIKNDCIPAFAANNGLHNCWPYFRQQLQYVTTNMGLPPFVLGPLLIRAKQPAPAK